MWDFLETVVSFIFLAWFWWLILRN